MKQLQVFNRDATALRYAISTNEERSDRDVDNLKSIRKINWNEVYGSNCVVILILITFFSSIYFYIN